MAAALQLVVVLSGSLVFSLSKPVRHASVERKRYGGRAKDTPPSPALLELALRWHHRCNDSDAPIASRVTFKSIAWRRGPRCEFEAMHRIKDDGMKVKPGMFSSSFIGVKEHQRMVDSNHLASRRGTASEILQSSVME